MSALLSSPSDRLRMIIGVCKPQRWERTVDWVLASLRIDATHGGDSGGLRIRDVMVGQVGAGRDRFLDWAAVRIGAPGAVGIDLTAPCGWPTVPHGGTRKLPQDSSVSVLGRCAAHA